MSDQVTREAKLNATKEIVCAYIKSAVEKEGEKSAQAMSQDDLCKLIEKVYGTIDSTLPNKEKKVGLGV